MGRIDAASSFYPLRPWELDRVRQQRGDMKLPRWARAQLKLLLPMHGKPVFAKLHAWD